MDKSRAAGWARGLTRDGGSIGGLRIGSISGSGEDPRFSVMVCSSSMSAVVANLPRARASRNNNHGGRGRRMDMQAHDLRVCVCVLSLPKKKYAKIETPPRLMRATV